jgi:hypothetical protein
MAGDLMFWIDTKIFPKEAIRQLAVPIQGLGEGLAVD